MAKDKAKGKSAKPKSLRAYVRERERLDAGLSPDQRRHGTATVERLSMVGPDGYETATATPEAPSGRQRIITAPLDRLLKADFITQREFDAADKYREDHYLAKLDPSPGAIDLRQAGGGKPGSRPPTAFASQPIADARLRVREAAKAMRGAVKAVLDMTVIQEKQFGEIGQEVFGLRDKREAAVAGRVAARMSFAALADYYGM